MHISANKHCYSSSPTTQIYNAHRIKIDDTQYWSDRSYFSKLYKSMKDAGIPHHDILSIWGNPYIGVATKWYDLSNKRWNVIEKEYPGIWDVAYNIDTVQRDFRDVLSKTTPEVRQFVNEFAIPIATMRTGAPSRLKQVAEKVSEYLYEIADCFNRAMIPGYSAYADGGSVEEIVTSAGSDLILTYCGGKAIKIGWQGLRYVGAKFVSTLRPKTTKILWGTWNDYPKITLNGKEYAKIGKRLYSKHAVNYMRPSGLGPLAGEMHNKEGVPIAGRSLAPDFIESIIQYGKYREVTMPGGVVRRIYNAGTSEIVTEQNGKLIVTINPFRGGKK